MQQQKEMGFKEKFNICHFLMVIHQRGLTIMCRSYWGKEALGLPCLLALILMFLWYVFTADSLMLLWMALWFAVYLTRKMQAIKVAGKVHSQYDGFPDVMRFVKNEKIAKLVVEPLLFGSLGLFALQYYEDMGWSPTGLPYFLLSGTFTLPFVALVNVAIWERQIQAIQDAKLEQEALAEETRNWR